MRENGTNLIGISFTGWEWEVLTGDKEGERQTGGDIWLINDSFYMLKKIIKTHTARLDFVDIIKPTFLRNAVATNRQ